MINSTATAGQSADTASSRFWFLFLGGCAGLGIWEAFSNVPTAIVAGFPLQPSDLVKGVAQALLGLEISETLAKLVHYATATIFYPICYLILTRGIRNFGMPANGLIWGVLTWFLALGILAPIAGQRFLLLDIPALTLMSLIGHVLYGYIAATVFEALEARQSV